MLAFFDCLFFSFPDFQNSHQINVHFHLQQICYQWGMTHSLMQAHGAVVEATDQTALQLLKRRQNLWNMECFK